MYFLGKDVILMAAYACTNGTFSHMQVIHAVDANVLGLIWQMLTCVPDNKSGQWMADKK